MTVWLVVRLYGDDTIIQGVFSTEALARKYAETSGWPVPVYPDPGPVPFEFASVEEWKVDALT